MSAGVVASHYVAEPPPPTLTVVGSQATFRSGFNQSFPFPAGIAVGDLLLLQIGSTSNPGSFPSGWTVVNSTPGGWFHGNTGWKIATSADVTAGSVGTLNLPDGGVGTVTAIRGAVSASVLYQLATPNPGDPSEAVAVPAGAGLLVYNANVRNQPANPAIDRGTQRSAVSGQYVDSVTKTEAAGAAVTVTLSVSGTSCEGTYYSVVRVT